MLASLSRFTLSGGLERLKQRWVSQIDLDQNQAPVQTEKGAPTSCIQAGETESLLSTVSFQQALREMFGFTL